MTKWISTGFFCLLITFQISAQAKTTKTVNSIPESMEEFLEMRDIEAITPEGGALMFLMAMQMYSKDAELGMQAFTVALHMNNVSEGDIYSGYAPNRGVQYDINNYYGKHKDHLGNSYFLGTKVANNYKLPAAPYMVEFTRNRYSEMEDGSVKVYIKCSGADSPRPITLKKNDKGIWKATTYSSLFVGVRKPPLNDRL